MGSVALQNRAKATMTECLRRGTPEMVTANSGQSHLGDR